MSILTKIRAVSRFPPFYRTFASHENGKESPWFRDNAPDPFPKTEEEKCAAAKKYGLLREEYEPYPDDGNGFGDYPKIRLENVEDRDPNLIWTDKHFRRNFAEVVPAEFIAYTPGRVMDMRRRHPIYVYILGFLGVPCTLALAFYYLGDIKVHHDVLEKQMYKPGVTYYTFDFDDEDSQKHH